MFGHFVSSAFDSIMMTGVTICILPCLLLPWFGSIFFFIACGFSFIIILTDSSPRLHFFAVEHQWDNGVARVLSVLLAIASIWLEMLCLVTLMVTGHPVCECYLITCFLVSTLVRTLYRNTGGQTFQRA
ncbi:hypothetical protein GGS21DRAFT_354647 [Xylaria nigripes]|nr:hypothetical protein GGS21DRAFT_354647 [Xylaria nigripes]